jgi:hypothetical protein
MIFRFEIISHYFYYSLVISDKVKKNLNDKRKYDEDKHLCFACKCVPYRLIILSLRCIVFLDSYGI